MAHGPEPTLEDLLREPIIRKVMASDGYSDEDIRRLMWQAGARGAAFDPVPLPAGAPAARSAIASSACCTAG